MAQIAVLADIHGNLAALEAVLADLGRQPIDQVLNLGDHASGPLWPRETLALLQLQPWTQIAGNHDRQLVQIDPRMHGESDRYAFAQLGQDQLDWLRALPPTAQHTPEILLCHGTPSDDTRYLLESVDHGRARPADRPEILERLAGTRAPLLLCGHSHTARVVQLDPALLIVNPGSVGLPAYEDDTPEPHVVEAGAPHARYALIERSDSGWRVELRAVPYDHDRAADQARRNGRSDWESALRTGCLR
jgi:predicted phosphodiesterase